MTSLTDRLAVHRAAYFFEPTNDPVAYGAQHVACWQAVSTAVRWSMLRESDWGLVPVFWGSVRDHVLTKKRFGVPFVEGVLFGLPTDAAAQAAHRALADIRLPGTLGAWADPPRPDDPAFSFPLSEFITHKTVVVLRADGFGPPRVFDPAVGLSIVRAAGEKEERWIDMRAGDLDLLAPHLVRMFGRNLGTWINEPRSGDSTERQLAHAQELMWAGAPMLASIVAARALEGVLRQRLVDADTPGAAEEKMLGRIINRAKVAGLIEPDAAKRMFEFARLRNTSAHAVAQDETVDVGAEVADFLIWFQDYIAL